MTSASTLFRKARETKDPKFAAHLRRQAALLRQKQDKPAKKAKSNGKLYGKHPDQMNKKELEDYKNAVRQKAIAHLAYVEQDKTLQSAIKEIENKYRQQMIDASKINHINVVCAFIADMEGTASLNGGALPPSVMVSGYTVARIIDVLRQAGYDTEGKRGDDRGSISKNTA